MGTHYESLGVPPGARPEEIRQAYRRLARRHHPDAQPGGDPAATEVSRRRMTAINAAWEVLGDPAARQAYDASLGVGPPPRPGTSTRSPGPGRPWRPLPDDPLDEARFGRGLGNFGFDDPDATPPPRRLSDLIVLTPVGMLAVALLLFSASLLTGSTTLRTIGLLMVVGAGVSFLIAPLFAMVRARSSGER